MAPARITDLPTEILLEILNHPTFPTETLYFLALLSRRINFIAIPIYLSRKGIDLETKSATVTLHAGQLDALSALQICLSISSMPMERLEFIFPHPSCRTIFPFLKQMKRVETFISGLSSVEEVLLKLDFTPIGRCLAPGTDEVLHAWATQFCDLLSCIVDKGCVSITVANGTYLTEAYRLDPPSFSQKYLPRLIRQLFAPLDAKTLGFKRNPTQGTDNVLLPMPSFSGRVSRLKSLYIDSATLILPPGLHWTLAALRHSSLTSLSMCMSRLDPDIWGTVLPLIASAAPNLTTVSLTQLDSPSGFHDAPCETFALAFLSRLPRLTNIELTHLQALWSYYLSLDPSHYLHRTRGSIGSLKHLTTLCAPVNLVADILSGAGSLPAIRTITVLWISPTHPHLEALMRFLSTITCSLAARHRPPQLSLKIEEMDGLHGQDTAVLDRLSTTRLTRLKLIESIQFEKAYNSPSFIGPMLAAFRGVKHVSVITAAPQPPAADVERLVREVRATKVLKTIEVNGKSYNLSND